MRFIPIVAAVFLVLGGMAGAEPVGSVTGCRSVRVAPGCFIPNTAPAKSGKRLVDDEAVVAFIQTARGRVLFTPTGAYVGMSAPPAGDERRLERPGEAPEREAEAAGPPARRLVVLKAGFAAAQGKGKGPAFPELRDRQSGVVNFLVGNREEWQTGLPVYRTLAYREVWTGIDLEYTAPAEQPEFRLIVRPGGDPEAIELETGAEELSLDGGGNLIAAREGTWLRMSRPRGWQEVDGGKTPVATRFRLLGEGRYGLQVDSYDPRSELTLASALSWSTLLGADGSGSDSSGGIAVDGAGSVYVAGSTTSAEFPTTAGAYDATFNGRSEAFVVKLNAAGSALLYATFIGGSGQDYANGIAVDPAGNAVITGQTLSADFPGTSGAYDPSFNGNSDAFILKLNASGSSLEYSTFLGGGNSESAEGLALDAAGNVYVTGYTLSTNFPTTPGAFDASFNGGSGDAFAARLNPAGTALLYSTYLGGSNWDRGTSLALDAGGNVCLAGDTKSADFPLTSGAFDATFNGIQDIFALKLTASGSTLLYSTLLGGSAEDYSSGIALDSAGDAYFSGWTYSDGFPTTEGAYDRTYGGSIDGIAAKLDASGAVLLYSTYLGGNGTENTEGIAVDSNEHACIIGHTNSTDFPVTAGAYDTAINGSTDVFVLQLNQTGSGLVYSTFLGGGSADYSAALALDPVGNVYLAGRTSSANFPATPGAFDTTHNGYYDVFVAKLNPPGSSLQFSTFLGGCLNEEEPAGIAVDVAGDVYVTGTTQSQIFPVTAGAFDQTFNGNRDAFISKLSAAGSTLVYSTYVGGNQDDTSSGIAVDAGGNAYVGGHTLSSGFPTTAGAFDRGFNGYVDAFLLKLGPTGSNFVYSTFLGGYQFDRIQGLAVDPDGYAYVAGYTASPDFPTTAGAFDRTYNGGFNFGDAFLAMLDPAGASLVYSTFLGGAAEDAATGVAVDAGWNAYVTGWTLSTDFPTTSGAFDRTQNGGKDAFIAKLAPNGSALSYSTFIGGSQDDEAGGVAVDGAGNAVMTGYTRSANFPATAGALDTTLDGAQDAFVARWDGSGSAPLFATFLGGDYEEKGAGIALNENGDIFLTGNTNSFNFPVTPGAFDSSYWNIDAFVTMVRPISGTLFYSTFLGGNNGDIGTGIVVNPDGTVYLTGYTYSTDFPTTSGAYDRQNLEGIDVFLTALWLGDLLAETPPELQAAAVSTNRISLSWTDPYGNESGFRIERKAGPAGSFALLATTGPDTTAFQDTGLPACAGFTFRVRAYNATGDTAWSNEASAATLGCLPPAPAALAASAVAYNRIDLTWTDIAVDEAGFEIERKTGSGGVWGAIATVGADVAAFADTAVTGLTTYFYRVMAYNEWGDSPWSNEAAATTPAAPPAAPSTLTAAAVAPGQINLAWRDNSANETEFRIERTGGAGTAWAALATTGPTERHFRDLSVAADTAYTYRVCALAGATASAYSNEAVATTSSTRPAAPSRLAAYAAGGSRIDLAWEDHAGNETGFSIERKVTLQADWARLATAGADATVFADTSPVAGAVCLYRVRAENAAGPSAWSNQAGASTTEYDAYIPAAAHTAGLNDTFWQTDLDLLNPYPGPVEAEVALLRADTGNSNPVSVTRSVPGRASVRLPDVLGTAFTAANAALGIRCPNGWVLPNSRFCNTASPCGGTYGMYIAGVGRGEALWGDGGATRGWFHQVGYSPDPTAGFRTNVGFVNASAFNVQVLMRLYGDGGELLGWLSHVLLPYEHRQFTRLHESLGTPAVSHGTITVEVLTEGGKVHAYAMLIDNLSGDPMYMPVEVIPW